MTWSWLMGWGIAGLCILLAYRRGLHEGIRKERLRCSHLALEAFDKRWSPTLRWVLNGISKGLDRLAPAEDFLDEEDAERKQKAKTVADLIEARDEAKKWSDKAAQELVRHYEDLMRKELGLD